MHKVFVYGTLLSGYGNNRLLKGQGYLGPARTRPELTLVNVGSFPGLIEGGNTAILGEVYEVDDACLKRLDSLEGCYVDAPEKGLYGRLYITLEDGREVMTYRFNMGQRAWARGNNREYEKIESGSWREFDSGHRRSYCG